MHPLLKAFVAASFYCLASLMGGCASSSLVDIWHDPSFKAPILGKILVIAVKNDATKRRIWEDAFTGGLEKHGVAATSSYSLFPDAPPDTDQVIAAVKKNGFDGILVTLRLPTEMNRQYIQGYESVEQEVRYGPYYGPYWQRYRAYYPEAGDRAQMDSQTVDVRAIDVTTTGGNGRLIWSATSRTADPGSVTDVQQGIVRLVTAELARRNIISPVK